MTVTPLESASFWASMATLWAAAGAWATYYGAVDRNRDERHLAVRTLLSGLTAELVVVSDWAGGDGNNPGYLQHSVEELEKTHQDWREPSRVIFSFECPTIRDLTRSPYISDLGPIVEDVVKLARSITRLFDYYGEYRQYVVSRPALYDSVASKLQPSAGGQIGLTEEELEYLHQVFLFNYKIHQGFIGGADSADPLCLYKTFRNTKASVNKFLENLGTPALPWWYWILHAVAIAAFVKGLLLMLKWLGLC